MLNTIATSAITAYLAAHGPATPAGPVRAQLQAQVDGYAAAFRWASVLIVVAAVFIKVQKDDLPAPEVAPAHVG
ncbi:hypothetical protein AB0M54_43935 [Actinoplanes sp. NPDC051470]|uniref:hypothetical protein n=1 Tax=Actinoplanes sp. NPDC051470 TaxID=3157224 RepID=UPI00342E9698